MGAGDTVLFTAATSGIALVGMQLAREVGAGMVIGSTRSAAKAPAILAAGARTAVSGDLAARVHDLTDGAGADVVLDHVGGEALADASAAARHGGSVVSVGRLGGATAPVDLFVLARSGVTLRSVSYGFGDPEVIGGLIDGLAAHVLPAVAAGRVRAVVASQHPRRAVADAFDALGSGGAPGKVVLTAS